MFPDVLYYNVFVKNYPRIVERSLIFIVILLRSPTIQHMKHYLFYCCLFFAFSTNAQKLSKAFLHEQFSFAASQYKVLKQLTPDSLLPRSYDSGKNKLVTSKSDWWCSGFYPGTLLYLYEYTHDDSLKAEALKRLQLLEKEQYNTGTHDLGFMMFCSFGNALRLFNNEADKKILLTSAASLSTRFNKTAGVIKSWDHGKWQFPVIIDNMMNLELLTWATKNSGDSSFYNIAVTHANTTIKNHYRPDFSSYHLVNYDTLTGDVLGKQTVQGAADSSAWARGQSWGLYGYTMMYRETGDKTYLGQAQHIADFLLHHPNLPADKIPYWDYNAPNIPNALRDVSAAAVMASALLELAKYADRKNKKEYLKVATDILKVLGSKDYRAQPGENGGFILKHSVGHLPANSEIDVPLTYADYYFIEALARYKRDYL